MLLEFLTKDVLDDSINANCTRGCSNWNIISLKHVCSDSQSKPKNGMLQWSVQVKGYKTLEVQDLDLLSIHSSESGLW